MVIVVNYQAKENNEGKAFFTLTVQGEPELVLSQKGKPYMTAPKASLMTTFEELTCRQMVGKQLPGVVRKVTCEPYEVTTEEGEVVTKTSRHEYFIEEPIAEQEEAVFQDVPVLQNEAAVLQDPFADFKPRSKKK